MLYTYSLIIVASLSTCLGAYYARLKNRSDLLVALYATFTVLSQILAAKIAIFDLGFVQAVAPAATLIFAVTFLLTDIVNEKFGKAETLKMIGISFVCQIVMLAFVFFATHLPPAPFWENQQEWELIFSLVPRITIASLVVFLLTESLDAYLFQLIKKWTNGRYLWMRNAFSSIISLSIDTVLFAILAFGGTGIPLLPLMLGQFFAKWTVAVVDIPFMYLNRWIQGRNHMGAI